MKRLLLILVVVFCCGFIADSYTQTTEVEQVKIVLADMTMHANNLEKQNIQLNTLLQNLVNDLKAIQEPQPELVELLKKYGITSGTDNNSQ